MMPTAKYSSGKSSKSRATSLLTKIPSRIIVCMILCVGMFGLSCGYKVRGQDMGPIVHEVRKVASFKDIHCSSGVVVSIKQDETGDHVEVTANQALLPYLKTEVSDGVLSIYLDNSKGARWTRNGFKNKVCKVNVRAKNIESIYSSSGSTVTTEGSISSDQLELKSSSGSNLTADVASSNSLTVEASSGSTIRLGAKTKASNMTTSSGSTIEVSKLITDACTLRASSGSTLNLKGKATQADAEASSGSTIQASELSSDTSNLRASSGASITINVMKSLKASAHGGGSISYGGHPIIISQDKGGGGSIEGGR